MKIASKAVVVYKKKTLLLLRDNIPTIYAPNKWSFPGGGGENGEGPEETLFRELKEEIGIIPTKFFYCCKSKDEDKTMCYLYFVKLTDKEVGQLKLGDEGQKMEFFSLDQTKDLDLESETALYLKKYAKEVIK